jgi:limonene-1,2-epoxide hydrolase
MSNADVVTDFIRRIEGKDLEAALELLADDVEYDNVPMGKVHGRDAVRDTLGGFLAGCDEIEWVVHRQAAEGDLVLNERTDRFRTGSGWMELPVAGVFELHDGRITLWRDYFDLPTFTSQLSG